MVNVEIDEKNFLLSKGIWGSVATIILGGLLALDPLTAHSGMAVISSGALALWGRLSAKTKIKLF